MGMVKLAQLVGKVMTFVSIALMDGHVAFRVMRNAAGRTESSLPVARLPNH